MFLFLWLLRCFNSPAYLQTPMYSVFDICQFGRWVCPFGNSRVKGCLGPHRDFSHPATSFFGFLCLGIHRLHLFVRNRLKCLSNCFALSKALLNRLKQVILNLMLVSNSQSIMVKYEWLINCQIATTMSSVALCERG